MKSLKLNTLKDCKKHRIKKQLYYSLKFPLSKFIKFTGMQLSNQCEGEKLIFYFSQLQKLDPILKVFSNLAFRSYVCFPYIFQLPKSFLRSGSKNDLRLKVRLMKSLAISDQKKRLNSEEFFNTINLRNDELIQIKKILSNY